MMCMTIRVFQSILGCGLNSHHVQDLSVDHVVLNPSSYINSKKSNPMATRGYLLIGHHIPLIDLHLFFWMHRLWGGIIR
eukprot:c27913_g1_i1 orf=26-262(+)